MIIIEPYKKLSLCNLCSSSSRWSPFLLLISVRLFDSFFAYSFLAFSHLVSFTFYASVFGASLVIAVSLYPPSFSFSAQFFSKSTLLYSLSACLYRISEITCALNSLNTPTIWSKHCANGWLILKRANVYVSSVVCAHFHSHGIAMAEEPVHQTRVQTSFDLFPRSLLLF